MKKIPLYNSTKITVVDDNDFLLLSHHNWQLMSSHNTFYARAFIGNQVILMHQLICPSPSKQYTPHHIDGDGLNNQRSNLSLATRAQQEGAKDKCFKTCSSQFKGVSWIKSRKCWRAYIRAKGIQLNLGYFDSEINAALAYNNAATKYFGEFAKLNDLPIRVSND